MGVNASVTVTDLRVRHLERDSFTPDGVSFEARPGDVVLVLGPSGCGKSTLALSINGLIPHAIDAEVEGTVITGKLDTRWATVAQLSEHAAMVFQDPDAQIVTGTVLDEVCFGPENRRMPVDEILRRAETALRTVGLWERRAANPDTLSGGGKQRLAIACALALGSELLVLDEATANLDPEGIDDVYRALAEIVATGRHSILLVEHNLDAAMTVVNRVVVLDREGHLVLDGTPHEVLIDQCERVRDLGVWLPVATLAALQLRSAGVTIDELPLTTRELTIALDALPGLPTPPPRAVPAAPGMELATNPGTRRNGDVIISVRDLSVTRGSTLAVNNVSLDIHRGEFLAVVGANGAGKTSLVQAIAGVVAPPPGRISVDGIDPATRDVSALTRRIGFVFQNPEHQFVMPTVFEELAQSLRLHAPRGTPLSSAVIEERVAEMLARFGLESHRDAHPFLLSGGQKRRLSVGTVLITGAPVIALDEPTFGQDRERAEELLSLLNALHEGGTTVIAVTHDMQLVAEYATSMAVLSDGTLLAKKPTGEVLADDDLLERAGLQLPPLARAMRALTRHPEWRSISRMRDLPGSES